MVYLVGAGPGDPGLITVRGVACLRRADLVLSDYLVNPELLTLARPDAEVIALGGHRSRRMESQEEINSQMVAAARRGKTVVRLKGGDPHVFGHSAEEIAALEAAGIAYETVPGVTAALAAAAYAAIPITHGQHSSAVALVTGQERGDKTESRLDYGALAEFPGTLIFYMGVTSATEWSTALIRRGKQSETPAVIVRRCSWADQETIRCTLGTVGDVIARRRIRPPAVVLVGEVVGLAPDTSWFTSRPLFGCRIVVTRPREQASDLAERLRELGAVVLMQPAIEISPPRDEQAVDEALERIGDFDWLVFSSANGVRYLLDRLWSRGGDLRRLGDLKLAAIGPGTAEALARYHLRADLVPDEFRAESLAESLADGAAGRRFLLARASRGREVLAEQLAAAGARVEQVVVYQSSDVVTPEPAVAEALAAGRVDWITVTSSAIARALVNLFGDQLRRVKLASLSPITSATLRESGLEPAAEAIQYTIAGLIEAIVERQTPARR